VGRWNRGVSAHIGGANKVIKSRFCPGVDARDGNSPTAAQQWLSPFVRVDEGCGSRPLTGAHAMLRPTPHHECHE